MKPAGELEIAAVVEEPIEVVVDVPLPRISEVVAILGGARREVDDDLDEDDSGIVVEDLPPFDETASLEGLAASPISLPSLPPPSDDPLTLLLCTLVDVAIAADSPHVASLLPGLLLEGRLDHTLPEDATAALAAANITAGSEVTPAFAAQTRAWGAILRGTSDDFAACGGAMLDEWAADLLARLLGSASRADALRRELRSRGVAAFGLVEAA